LHREQVPINEILEVAVQQAHEAVQRRLPEAGTTLTLALLLGESLHLAHIGDSRAYVGRRGSLELLTEDHSVAARLLEIGEGSPEELASQRHKLYRAVGQGMNVEPDILYRDLESDHYLMLCCDGLWSMISDEAMVKIAESAPTPAIACERLVAQAKERGGEDNISVILAAWQWPFPRRSSAPSELAQRSEGMNEVRD
jgi:protein phosphatase